MTATITPTTTTIRTENETTTRTTTTAARPVWQVGAASGLVAAAATTLVAIAAKAVDVPMMAAEKSDDFGREIPMWGFATSTLMCTAIGLVLAVALLRWAKRPARTFVAVTTVLTVLSMAGPITTGHATTATRLVLGLTHVVAAAIVIPALAGRLGRRGDRR